MPQYVRPTSDVNVSEWRADDGTTTALYSRVNRAVQDTAEYMTTDLLDARKSGLRGMVLVIGDDEDSMETRPTYGRALFNAIMNVVGTRFEFAFGPHSLCAPFRAMFMSGQYEQNNHIGGNTIWSTSPGRPNWPGSPLATPTPAGTSSALLMDFVNLIYGAAAGNTTRRFAQTALIGKLINEWPDSLTSECGPIFYAHGLDYQYSAIYNPENKGGGPVVNNAYQVVNAIFDATATLAASTLECPSVTDAPQSIFPIQPVATASWSSAAGGTLTIVSVNPHGLHNGQAVDLAGFSPSPWNRTNVTANVIDSKTVTITSAGSNPGTASVQGQVEDVTGAGLVNTVGNINWHTFHSQNVADWMGARFHDVLYQFCHQPATDPRYKLPFLIVLTPNAPHAPTTPLPSLSDGLGTLASATVASASNGVHTNTLTGSQSLTVSNTAGYTNPTSAAIAGQICVMKSGKTSYIRYTDVDPTHFLNCTAVGDDITLATSDPISIFPCVADRTARQNSYNDPWIPPHFDYRRVQVAATGGTWKVRWRGQLTSALAWNAPANSGAGNVQTAIRALSGATGTETVTGGPGDATGSTPYVIKMSDVGDGDFTKPNATVLTFDTSALVGTIDSAWPTIDVNDPVVQGTGGLYVNPGSSVNNEQNRLQQLVAVDDLMARIVAELADPTVTGTSGGILDEVVIAYATDNGTFSGNGAHFKNSATDQKDSCFLTDLQIPWIVRGPGIPANKINRGPVSGIQFFPWVMATLHGDVNALPSPLTIDGDNWVGVIADETSVDHKVFPISGLGQDGVIIGRKWHYFEDSSPNGQKQDVELDGSPTGGTFTLTYTDRTFTLDGALNPTITDTTYTTAAIAFNAPATGAGSVQAALAALTPIGSTANVAVTFTGGKWHLTFQGALANRNLLPLIGNGASLTGGTSPVALATVTTSGGPAKSLFNLLSDPFEMCNLIELYGTGNSTLDTFVDDCGKLVNGGTLSAAPQAGHVQNALKTCAGTSGGSTCLATYTAP